MLPPSAEHVHTCLLHRGSRQAALNSIVVAGVKIEVVAGFRIDRNIKPYVYTQDTACSMLQEGFLSHL